MLTNNPISQNNDDYFYTAVCAYVRGEANGIVPGTVGEEQGEIAKRLLQENPAILVDPSTAEIDWTYAQTLDPYGDRLPLLPQAEQVGREYFARAPGSDIWVCVRHLPDATRGAIWERFENTKGAVLRIGIDRDGQLRLSGFPPDWAVPD